MEIRVRATGAVMLEDEFRAYQRAINGPSWGTTTDEVLEALGADVVFEGPQATGGTVYQFSMRQGVEQIGGKWHTKYVLGPIFTDNEDATAAEQEAAYKTQKDAAQAKSVRNQRDQLLKDTDWRVIKALESNIPQDFDWAAYRQALRDIPSQAGFPWEVQWPTKPE